MNSSVFFNKGDRYNTADNQQRNQNLLTTMLFTQDQDWIMNYGGFSIKLTS